MRGRTSNTLRLLATLLAFFCAVSLLPARCFSATASAGAPSSDTAERVAKLEQEIAAARTSADNSWMLVSSALVLMMTGPGLALFYGGLVRKKNVLATLMQSFALMALITVLWALVGYSLCFHSGNRFVGGLGYFGLRGVGPLPDPDYAATIPQQTFMVFQLMFAIITPALITGAFAERMKFSAMVLFMVLWSLAVYDPMAHMVWGKGGLLNATLGGRIPTLDFAGGTVVHISSGVSALVCALYLGKRLGYPKTPMPPHSVVLSFIGACLLWVGWFGFNAGSALAAGSLATSAFVATHFSAAAGAIGWSVSEWLRNAKPSALGAISGSVAGLVAITPASGFVGPISALVIGLVAGFGCYFMVAKVKARFGYDDSLDAFGVHGAGGTIGALLTGVFATKAVNAVFKDAPVGLVDGNAGQVWNQFIGVLVTWVLALVGTLVILKVVDVLIGLRVPEEHEVQGLDVTQHGEEGYNLEDNLRCREESRTMKKIEAIIQPSRFELVKEALSEIGVEGMTVSDVRGHGRQKGHTEVYRGREYTVDLLPKIKIEMVLPDHLVDAAVNTILKAAKTGKIGDGKIFLSDVKEAIRVRNEERGENAL